MERTQGYTTSKVEIHSKSPPTFSQIAVVASKLAVASNLPDGDQEQDLTVLVCVSSRTACIIKLDHHMFQHNMIISLFKSKKNAHPIRKPMKSTIFINCSKRMPTPIRCNS